ncbi:hypothetical protein N7478_003177 [Penicillium angulare]|uniref:uncharacterized protein n=1 Tax=Penicillium angulare TaxID=116970 RepID=UPI002541B591|nr:uncharacterized protein N7478_003177 [Penicillium angulare]KAJ5287491.1 hypothetical protein N7478_003177 [Penicillium angulare]
MLTSGRPCLGRRLSIALDTVAAGPEDPLLFLYPRWAASAVQQRRPIASLALRAAPKKSNRTPRSFRTPNNPSVYTSPRPFPQQSTQWHSNLASRDLNDPPESLSSPVQDDNTEPTDNAYELRKSVSSNGSVHYPHLQVEVDDDLAHVPHNRTGQNTTRTNPRERRKEGQRRAAASTESQHQSKLDPTEEIQEILSVRDRRKLRYEAYLKQTQPQAFSAAMHESWEDMMYLIEEVEEITQTQTRRSNRHRELLIPEETVAALSGMIDKSMKENIWYMHLRNGCKVQILHPREGDGMNRKVILTGSERTTELIKGDFQRIQSLQASGDPLVEIGKPPVSIYATRENAPTIRGVWNFLSSKKKPFTLESVLASRPSLSTVKEFAEFVEDLTNAHGLSVKSTKGIPNGRSVRYGIEIAQHIEALFQDDTYRKVFSTAALNQALEFLCGRDQLKAARLVFRQGQYVATADTYNILLRSAGRRQDIKSFRWCLKLMAGAKISPNSDTWLALLETFVTPSTKVSLITRMAHKGLLTDVAVIRSALQITIQDSLYVHLQNGQNVESYFALMKQTHGADWFNATLLGQMFSVASRLKNFDAVNELLAICAKESFAVDGICLAQIMPMCRSSISRALHYTFEFGKFSSFRFVPQVWERLFLIAFKSRKYNICRVLWRHACLQKSVTYKMKQTVLSTLSRNVSYKKTDQIRELWDINAGKVIVGLDQNTGSSIISKSTLAELPSEFQDNPLLFLTSGFKSAGEQRDLQLRVAKEIVNTDIFQAPKYEPVNSVFIMLEAAAIMDEQWKGAPRPLNWVLQNAIQIPVKPRQMDTWKPVEQLQSSAESSDSS